MKELTCILEHNDCWKKYHNFSVPLTGIVVHSTDKAGGVIRRFVQPYSGQTSGLAEDGVPVGYDRMIALLGKNSYDNDWNRSGMDVCVHAFLGKIADGSYAACKTLDWTQPCWGAGAGKNGSYNGCLNGKAQAPLYIQFEMIEDSVGSKAHCTALYNLAVEFCARRMYEYPTIKINNVVSHHEAYLRGYATNHGDPESYWQRCGTTYTMDGFRRDVQTLLKELEEYDGMTKAEFEAIIDERASKIADEKIRAYFSVLNTNDAGSWSRDARAWATETGLINGIGKLPDGKTNYAWPAYVSREQLVTILYRQELAGIVEDV